MNHIKKPQKCSTNLTKLYDSLNNPFNQKIKYSQFQSESQHFIMQKWINGNN